MNAFKAQVTLLLMIAMILISVLSVITSYVVYSGLEKPEIRYVYGASEASVLEDEVKNSEDEMGFTQYPLLFAYAVLIASCAAFVSIVVGNMVVRPLRTLESAIETVNPQAIMPKIVESGDGADLITVRLLNQLSETLKNTLNSRMRLVAAAGHDLRTPLTRMRLRAEMLEDQCESAKWIKDVDEMSQIADSTITLVKEEAVSREYSVVRVDSLALELISELELIGHIVSPMELDQVEVEGSPVAIKRALSNLMTNACVHGKNASISISKNKKNCVITINDEGPGIPEDVIQNAFEPFFQVSPARTKSHSGAGLGLAIVKEIIQRHGGSISLSNRVSGGLHQEVQLPLVGFQEDVKKTGDKKKRIVFDRDAFSQGVKDAITIQPILDSIRRVFKR